MIPLTSDRHDDWVRVYNAGHQNLSGFVPLHTQELRNMIRNHQFWPEDMYLAIQGRRSIAVARYLEDAHSSRSFIADLASLPNMNSGVEALVEFFMERTRENGSTSLASWAFTAQVRVPDILSRFTFDTRRVRHEMFADLDQAEVRGSLGSTEVRKCDSRRLFLKAHPLYNVDGVRPLDLFELRDEISYDWWPRYLGFSCVSGGHLMVASRSKRKRKEGRIDLTDMATSSAKQDNLLSELIHDMVFSLYHDGVRQVRLEIDAGIGLKQFLIDTGFEVRRTLLEMCLDILQG
ncbi:MAG: hypothetical protein ACFFC0_07585 [Promethearchaeota archaeon]